MTLTSKKREVTSATNATQNISRSSLVRQLSVMLLSSSFCTVWNDDEAGYVADAVIDEMLGEETNESESTQSEIKADSAFAKNLASSVRSYFGEADLSVDQALSVASAAVAATTSNGHSLDTENGNDLEEGEDEENKKDNTFDDGDDDDDDDDDGDYVGEGECELCERTIKLTRHHLIPRAAWPRVRRRLELCTDALEKFDRAAAACSSANGESERKTLIEKQLKGADFPLPLPMTASDRRLYLQRCVNICSPCHASVHRAHDEMTLAEHYNTIDKLLQDDSIFKFAKWASKQRPGKHSVVKR